MPCPTEIHGGKKLIAPQTHVAIGGAPLGGAVALGFGGSVVFWWSGLRSLRPLFNMQQINAPIVA